MLKRGMVLQNNVTKKTFLFDSFLEALAENPNSIFKVHEQRKWLKIDMMTAKDDWQCLFQEYDLKKLGDVYYFKMPTKDSFVEYYIHEIKKGLLMFFSLSRREEYNSTLRPFVKHTLGITQMWFPLESFESAINFIKSHYSSNIYSFTARRLWSSKHPAQRRGDISRTIRYSGDDADYSLTELREIYGVLPTLVDLQIGSDKIRMTNDGFFLIRNINRTILRIVEEVIDQTIAEPIRLRDVSKRVSYLSQETTWDKFKITKLMSGKIYFNAKLSGSLIEQLFHSFKDEEIGRAEEGLELPNFSFIDTNLSDEPLHYSATAVDEDKGTMFGISGNCNSLIVVPKHKTTFESFINFYRLVNETMDESSSLSLFNESYAK